MPVFSPSADTVATPSAAYMDMHRDWRLLDDLDGGVNRMRWRGIEYLPREQAEEPDQYAARLRRTNLYPGLRDALNRSVSKPFSRPVAFENVPDQLEATLQNADGMGADITQFGRSLLRAATKHGMAHVLVDFTANTDGTLAGTASQRPIWRLIQAPNLLSWGTVTRPDGTMGLSEIRVHSIEPDGKRKREYVTIWRLDSFERWENTAYQPPTWNVHSLTAEFYDYQDSRPQEWTLESSGPFGPPGGFDALPVATLYTHYTGFMQAVPAFAALAETNLAHWQSNSDQRNLAHTARVPILFGRGMTDEQLKGLVIGSGTAFFTQSESADLSYVEHGGAAMSLGAEDLKTLEEQMEMLGVRPMMERTGNATATSAAIAETGATTDIQAWIEALNSTLEDALNLSMQWLNIEVPDDPQAQPTVNAFKDFVAATTGNDDLAHLRVMRDAGDLDRETYLREVKRRGLLDDDVDLEELLAALEAADTELRESMEPQGAEPAEGVEGADNVADTALNGAQVTALQGVVQAVANKELPREAAKILIRKAFPSFTQDEVRAMVDDAATSETQPPQEQQAPPPGMGEQGQQEPSGGMPQPTDGGTPEEDE